MENVYFAKDWSAYASSSDVVLFFSSEKRPTGIYHGEASRTIVLDLKKDESLLLGEMRKSTRQDIRRASENASIRTVRYREPTRNQTRDFCRMYDAFAEAKGIPKADLSHLLEAREKGILALLYVFDETDRAVCGAADFILNDRGFGAYAFSGFREHTSGRIAGQANKWLYWLSVQHAKREGCDWFDLGGMANPTDGLANEGINDFKSGFGGQVIDVFDFYKGYSLKGVLLVLALKLLRKKLNGWV